jgi:hypothetical protein
MTTLDKDNPVKKKRSANRNLCDHQCLKQLRRTKGPLIRTKQTHTDFKGITCKHSLCRDCLFLFLPLGMTRVIHSCICKHTSVHHSLLWCAATFTALQRVDGKVCRSIEPDASSKILGGPSVRPLPTTGRSVIHLTSKVAIV